MSIMWKNIIRLTRSDRTNQEKDRTSARSCDSHHGSCVTISNSSISYDGNDLLLSMSTSFLNSMRPVQSFLPLFFYYCVPPIHLPFFYLEEPTTIPSPSHLPSSYYFFILHLTPDSPAFTGVHCQRSRRDG